jgi:sulfate transport system permease protein
VADIDTLDSPAPVSASAPGLAVERGRGAPVGPARVAGGTPRGGRPHGSRAVRWTLRTIALTYVIGLVALPVAMVVRRTFAGGAQAVLTSLANPDLIAAARLGLIVATASVLVNTVFGVGIPILLVRYRFPGRRLLGAAIDLPVSISPVVVGISLILVYGHSGWLGRWFETSGMKIVFATPGIILATVIVSLPLVVREVVPVLEEAGTDQDQAAQSLGASAWQRFVRITLPTIRWALAYGVVLSLARSLGEFGAVRVVSGSVAGESQTPTLFVNDSYQEFGPAAEQDAFTAAFCLMVVAVVFIILIAWLRPKERP